MKNRKNSIENVWRKVSDIPKRMSIVVALTLVLLPTACTSTLKAQPAMQESMPVLDAILRAAIIDSVTMALDSFYVFPNVAKDMKKHVKKLLKEKTYDNMSDHRAFAEKLTEDLRSICHDRHLGIFSLPPERIREEVAEPDSAMIERRHERELAEARRDNFGFVKIERMEGNIGYLRFDGFSPTRNAGATAIAAMNFLAYSDALIIDLRYNGGGSPEMIQLISSYFFDEPKHLNSFYLRPRDTITQFWTSAWVEGPRMEAVDIYILTSAQTFSGAEEFTYNLKNMERATVIGETTGGGAHPVMMVGFPDQGIGMSVPMGRAINPITGTNWEGTGIDPHIACPADSALSIATYEALKGILKKATDEDQIAQLNWAIESIEAQRSPYEIDSDLMKSYAGKYGPRSITLEDGQLFYQREDRPKFKMLPISDDTFMFAELDFFRLQFMKNSDGKIVAVEGIYRGGRRDRSERSGT